MIDDRWMTKDKLSMPMNQSLLTGGGYGVVNIFKFQHP